jgi:Tfp pilus assembly PilM family ATPase
VVVNLPEARCFVRVIHVDNMPDAEIESAVPFEAESYIPIPIEQVYLDWMKIGEKERWIIVVI